MYPVRMMDTASSVPCNTINGGNTATAMVHQSNTNTGDSDSAVSSMGSERVSSDTEWMETNSDSGHNDGYHPSHSQQEYG